MTRRRLACLVLFAGCLPPAAAAAATLEIVVRAVHDDRGQVRIGVCRRDEFLSETCAHHAVVAASAGEVRASIADVPPGTYAVAAYQDIDGSGRLRRTFFGMPQEDLGFSRDPVLRFGPPSFQQSAIVITGADCRVVLTLHRFGS